MSEPTNTPRTEPRWASRIRDRATRKSLPATNFQALLPARYRNGVPVSNAPMGSADLVYDADGKVAWNRIWEDFCDLAMAGGPPHRDTLLQPATEDEIATDPEGYAAVLAELERGLGLITGWPVTTDVEPGWIGLRCPDSRAAAWLELAIGYENVAVERAFSLLYLPAGPHFRLEGEIKNVITSVAKTHHYWTEHRTEAEKLRSDS